MRSCRQQGRKRWPWGFRLCINRTDFLWKITSLEHHHIFIVEQTELAGTFGAEWILFTAVYFLFKLVRISVSIVYCKPTNCTFLVHFICLHYIIVSQYKEYAFCLFTLHYCITIQRVCNFFVCITLLYHNRKSVYFVCLHYIIVSQYKECAICLFTLHYYVTIQRVCNLFIYITLFSRSEIPGKFWNVVL